MCEILLSGGLISRFNAIFGEVANLALSLAALNCPKSSFNRLRRAKTVIPAQRLLFILVLKLFSSFSIAQPTKTLANDVHLWLGTRDFSVSL